MAGADLAFGRFYGDVWRLIRSAGGAVWAIALGAVAWGAAVDLGLLGDVSPEDVSVTPGFLVAAALQIALFGLAAAAIAMMLDARRQGRAVALREAAMAALGQAGPVVVLNYVTWLAIMAGFALLIAPGLYLFAMWGAMTPALMLENARYGAATRSAELTKGARWRVLALFLPLVVMIAPSLVLEEVFETTALENALLDAATTLLGLIVFGAWSVTLYRRLTDSSDNMAERLRADHPFLSPQDAARLTDRHDAGAFDLLRNAVDWADLGRNFGGGLTQREVVWIMEREPELTAQDLIRRDAGLAGRLSDDEVAALETWMRDRRRAALSA